MITPVIIIVVSLIAIKLATRWRKKHPYPQYYLSDCHEEFELWGWITIVYLFLTLPILLMLGDIVKTIGLVLLILLLLWGLGIPK